jgi:[glutamine synthetase] adenylyltransferase / [glutamine synthetase]-adenylyl-L-tyrosine phosphorylase
MLNTLRRMLSGDESARATFDEHLALLGFCDSRSAGDRLSGLIVGGVSPETAAVSLLTLTSLLSEVADPESGLGNFERLVSRASDRAGLFRFLSENPRAIEILVRLFAGSRYLTEILLRNPESVGELIQHRRLADLKCREEFLVEALAGTESENGYTAQLDALRRYQRTQILRIGACDSFGLFDLRAATVQLSLLADSLVQACLILAARELNVDPASLAVLALGKLGGEELNYSSDIDLVFLTDRSSPGATALAQRLIKALQDSSSEGFLYRVDVRLRPWGRSGELVTTIPSYVEYLQSHAERWEKQALLKGRVIAGNFALGKELLRRTEPLVFGGMHRDVRVAVRQAKDRIEAELKRRGRDWGEVKLGTGSIRDVEFVVQALQLVHGQTFRHVRSPNTLDGLVRLTDAGILHADEYRRLTDGYVFLRTIEHSLQLMNNRQEHSLPDDARELFSLARRLDFGGVDQLLSHYENHRASIRRIFDKYLSDESALTITAESSAVKPSQPVKPTLPTYESEFTAEERTRHREWLAQIDAERPVRVVANDAGHDGLRRVTVVGFDCPGELSMICGLMFAYGFDIITGFVSTESRSAAANQETPCGFVDVFSVRSEFDVMMPEVWNRYQDDLRDLVQMARMGHGDEAQGRLAKRVADALEGSPVNSTRPTPLDVRIDNEVHDRATVLYIRGDDTIGFLYELSNALTLSGVNIERVSIQAEEGRASDTLLVTDAQYGGKILDESRLQELQAAVVLIKHFTHLLPGAPDPTAALLHFRSFLRDLFRRPDWLEQLSSLERPEVLSALARLLGVSDFLWEDFLRLQYANLFPVLRDISGLERAKSVDQLAAELRQAIHTSATPDDRRRVINEFKDRELFRIDMRHILGNSGGLDAFGREMTDLAEVLVAECLAFCESELVGRFGEPRRADGRRCHFNACALGKCGGRELGFASDIELMFVYDEDGQTNGTESITNANYFAKLVESFSHSIQSRGEGVFHIDLRLRPYGRAGSLAVSRESFRQYYHPDGPAWPYERQSLVKMRPIAGDPEFGRRLVALRDELVYTGRPVDFSAIRAMRQRQVQSLGGSHEFNAKLSPGGLVDLEYLVQALQISHGSARLELRTTNTHEALDGLARLRILDSEVSQQLNAAYAFLRQLIEALRMVRGDARDLTVPAVRSPEFESLARRLGYGGQWLRLQEDLTRHTQFVASAVRSVS